MITRAIIVALAWLAIGSNAFATPSWVERAKERISLGPVVGQEYRLDSEGDLKSTGLITVGAVHYSLESYWTVFAFYGLSNRAVGENHQVAGGGSQYVDALGITVLVGADVDGGLGALQFATTWFVALGLAFNGFEIDLTGAE